MERKLLNEEEAAEILGFGSRWLRTLRLEGKAPEHIRIGNKIRYRPEDIDKWLEQLRATQAG